MQYIINAMIPNHISRITHTAFILDVNVLFLRHIGMPTTKGTRIIAKAIM